jgi:hypothetical protein
VIGRQRFWVWWSALFAALDFGVAAYRAANGYWGGALFLFAIGLVTAFLGLLHARVPKRMGK